MPLTENIRWVITLTVAIAGFVTPFVLPRILSNAPQLLVESTIWSPTIPADKKVKFEFLYNDKTAKDISFERMTFANQGGTPIRKEDFEAPIILQYKKGIEVLDVFVVSRTPGHVSVSVEIQKDKLVIAPLLLNPGDNFTLEAVTSGEYSSPEILTRIARISDVEKLSVGSNKSTLRAIGISAIIALLMLYFGMLAGAIFSSLRAKDIVVISSLFEALVGTAALAATAGWYSSYWAKTFDVSELRTLAIVGLFVALGLVYGRHRSNRMRGLIASRKMELKGPGSN